MVRKKQTYFQDAWLSDVRYSSWVAKVADSKMARCLVCRSEVTLSNMGCSALDEHARGQKHIKRLQSQPSVTSFFKKKTSSNCISSSSSSSSTTDAEPSSSSTSSSRSNTLDNFTNSGSVLNAEILWTLKVVQSHLSFRSCEEINRLFAVMFPDSEVAAKFQLGKTKCAYLINYGIAPYLRNKLLKSINDSCFFSLSFDESLNNVLQSCQMDINVRLWNERKNLVETYFLDSKFLERPNADNLFEELKAVLGETTESKMIHLSMDGPSVNWKVLEKLDEYLEKKDLPSTIHIGSCNQHNLHGAFKISIQNSGWEVDKILKALYWILHDSPARRNVYRTESGTTIFPLRFCPTRWIEDQPVAERAVSIWGNFKNVVSYWEGLCKSARPANKSYETLTRHYNDLLIPLKLQFFAFIADILKPYLIIFQTNKPLVAFMADELTKIFDQLLRLIFRRKALEKADTPLKRLKLKWLCDESNHLEDGLIDVGAATKDLLQKVEVSLERKRKFKGECKKIVLDLLIKIREKSPLNYCLVRNAASLNPVNMIRESENSSIRFRSLADKLFSLKRISSTVADHAKNQYDELLKVVKYEKSDLFRKFDFKVDRLDVFLSDTLAVPEFKDLWQICKIIFVLSHGQSDVERGFSINKEILQDNLQEKSLISQRLIYDFLQRSENLHDFVISPELHKSCRFAYSRYKSALDEKKEMDKKTEKSLKRKSMEDELQIAKRQKIIISDAIGALRKGLIEETKKAEKNKDLSGLAKAAAFCTGIEQKEKELESCEDEINSLIKSLKD